MDRTLFCCTQVSLIEPAYQEHLFHMDALETPDIPDNLPVQEAPPPVEAPVNAIASSTVKRLRTIKKVVKDIIKTDTANLSDLRSKRLKLVGAIAELNNAAQTKESELYHLSMIIDRKQMELHVLDLAIGQGMDTMVGKLTGVYTEAADAYKVAKGR